MFREAEVSGRMVRRTKILMRDRKNHFSQKPVRSGAVFLRSLLRGGVGDVGVNRGQQVAGGFFVFVVDTTFVEPMLKVLSRRRRKLGEEKSSAALIAGPDHIRVAL